MFEKQKKGFGGRGRVIGITAVLVILLPVVFVVWRRSRRRRPATY